MSLLDQIQARGVTLEDLEKAAAVRLFEKAAAAEGVDLNQLSENQVQILFSHFSTQSHSTKEASAMNDEIVELFEKTAADEGIDLDDMSDEELAELYNHYVENVLPEQIEAADEYEKAASIEDAHEKLAEAEILGRHMARAYWDEVEKIAADDIKYIKQEDVLAKRKAAAEAEEARRAARNVGLDERKARLRQLMAERAAKRNAEEPSRADQIRAARKRAAARKENPQGTRGPAATVGGKLSRMEAAARKGGRPSAAADEAASRAASRIDAARSALRGRFYDAPMKAVGGFRNQIGAALGGGTRQAARLRGNIALGSLGALGTAGAGYGLYRGMRKESSFDDEVVAYLDELTGGEFSDDPALDTALDILIDAGYDIDDLI